MTGREYHTRTAHRRNRISPHFLDWDNAPMQFKKYDTPVTVPLDMDSPMPEADLWALVSQGKGYRAAAPVDLATLSSLLILGLGYVRGPESNGRQNIHRTPPSAGGLYPCELYAAVHRSLDIPSGLYSCNMARGRLELLKPTTAGIPSGRSTETAVTFFVTGVVFRSAWKYRERAFRYLLLDAGHVVENLVLSARASGFSCRISYDFDDDAAGIFLGLDSRREVCLIRIDLDAGGSGKDSMSDPSLEQRDDAFPEVRELREPVREVLYDTLEAAVQAGKSIPSLGKRRPGSERTATVFHLGPAVPISEPAMAPDRLDFVSAVLSRRSRRNYARKPCSHEDAMALLSLLKLLPGIPFHDDLKGTEHTATGVIAGAVDGLDPGFYLLSRDRKSLHSAESGILTGAMAHICLDQAWLTQAAFHFVFLPDLAGLDHDFGPRGYRYAMINAGRMAQRIYLGATALGLGCCGIGAFYDDEAGDLLNLAQGVSLAYLVAAGPVKKTF